MRRVMTLFLRRDCIISFAGLIFIGEMGLNLATYGIEPGRSLYSNMNGSLVMGSQNVPMSQGCVLKSSSLHLIISWYVEIACLSDVTIVASFVTSSEATYC